MGRWSERSWWIRMEVPYVSIGKPSPLTCSHLYFLGLATAWDEYEHFEEVERRKREIYSVEFQAKVYESMLAPLQPIASQIPATQLGTQKTVSISQNAAASSQLSGFDTSGNSAMFSSSASQANANVSRFLLYLLIPNAHV
jgi:hypothetical protein